MAFRYICMWLNHKKKEWTNKMGEICNVIKKIIVHESWEWQPWFSVVRWWKGESNLWNFHGTTVNGVSKNIYIKAKNTHILPIKTRVGQNFAVCQRPNGTRGWRGLCKKKCGYLRKIWPAFRANQIKLTPNSLKIFMCIFIIIWLFEWIESFAIYLIGQNLCEKVK
jgi:hypothetical protein